MTRASTTWILLLTIASTATTLVFACATPFPALAALAAVHMHRRDGVMLMIASWVASQAVGFCVLGYPRDASTLAWGAAIGLAAIAGVLAAGAAARGTPAVRLVLAYVAAFAGFKLAILVASLALGGVGTALSVEIMTRQFVRNGAILIGLLALYHALRGAGIPAPARRSALA
ncbi:hypothetical protein U1701_15525 [Sphingomonas sp. PB2P19]|uniref:hypothetical protein n=1 Tax=Sphingomonas rhamnosi TaxID=3096156 RepID=UPI002FCAE5A7